jgi:hypothetical protein
MKDYKNFLSNPSNLEFLSRIAVTGFIQFSKYVVILLLHRMTDILKTDTTFFLEGINRRAKLKLHVYESVHRDTTMKITNKVRYMGEFIIPSRLYMFRAMFSPIIRSTWLYLQYLVVFIQVAAGWCPILDTSRQQLG